MLLRKEWLMKRDMDIVRQIIMATARQPFGQQLFAVDGVSEEDFVAHTAWLIEAGLVVGEAEIGAGSFASLARIARLTWDGCEFADSVMSDTLWSKAKSTIIKPGLSFTFDILREWLKAEITNGFPALGRSAG